MGSSYTFVIKADVTLSKTFKVDDITIEQGNDLVAYIGNNEINKVSVNGQELLESEYYVKDYSLHISKDKFLEGDNEVIINDNVSFEVTVKNMDETVIDKTIVTSYVPILVGSLAGGLVLLAGVVIVIILIIRKRKVL